MNCQLCSDEAKDPDSNLCPLHARSLGNLRIAHDRWNTAYGGMLLEDFLKKIAGLPETGQATKDVARYVLSNPSRWK